MNEGESKKGGAEAPPFFAVDRSGSARIVAARFTDEMRRYRRIVPGAYPHL